MPDPKIKNLLASIRQRLLNLAHERNDDFGLVLTKYGLERMLFRLSRLAGTDSPLDNVGTASHLNLRDQVKFGLEPWQALQSATLLPTRAYHKDRDLGSLEVGKLADMVFVTGNPLVNIADASNVERVMKNGRLYTLPELEAPIKATEPAPVKTTELGQH